MSCTPTPAEQFIIDRMTSEIAKPTLDGCTLVAGVGTGRPDESLTVNAWSDDTYQSEIHMPRADPRKLSPVTMSIIRSAHLNVCKIQVGSAWRALLKLDWRKIISSLRIATQSACRVIGLTWALYRGK